MSYTSYSVNLTEGQKDKLARAYKNKCELTLRLKHNQLSGDFPLSLTSSQINKINKSKNDKTGLDIRLTKTQMSAQKQNGGFLGAIGPLLARVAPTVMRLAPKALGALATGALGGLADTGIKKIFGSGMVTVPNNKKKDVLKIKELTPGQIKKLEESKGDCCIKLTKKQQTGGFLPILASLGIPLLASMFSGKGLQIDPTGRGLQIDPAPVSYRRTPRVKKK